MSTPVAPVAPPTDDPKEEEVNKFMLVGKVTILIPVIGKLFYTTIISIEIPIKKRSDLLKFRSYYFNISFGMILS